MQCNNVYSAKIPKYSLHPSDAQIYTLTYVVILDEEKELGNAAVTDDDD